MAGVPPWLIGIHVTTVTAVQQTVAADGTFTPGTSNVLFGTVDEVNVSSQNTLDVITPMSQRQENQVISGSATIISISQILKSNGVNLLAAIGYASDYVMLTLTRGGQTFTFYGVIQSYTEGLRRGKSTGTLSLAMCSPGSANPAYA